MNCPVIWEKQTPSGENKKHAGQGNKENTGTSNIQKKPTGRKKQTNNNAAAEFEISRSKPALKLPGHERSRCNKKQTPPARFELSRSTPALKSKLPGHETEAVGDDGQGVGAAHAQAQCGEVRLVHPWRRKRVSGPVASYYEKETKPGRKLGAVPQNVRGLPGNQTARNC